MPRFDGAEILAALHRHDVEFVTIGGFAAVAQGSPLPTNDVDVVPAPDQQNLARLSDALDELDAKVRVVDAEPVAFRHDADSLAAGQMWNLATSHGDLDIVMRPAGTQGFDDLRRDAVTVVLRGVEVRLASLADIVRSKEAAGRDKDRRALPVLRELVARELLARRDGRPA